MDAVKTKPFWQLQMGFVNARKQFKADIFILPTISLQPWRKSLCSLLRYPEGSFDITNQLMFSWLFWEFSLVLNYLNYKYKD